MVLRRGRDRWDRVGGLEIVQQFANTGTAELQRNAELFWCGVPEHLRKHVYMLVRGACVRACVHGCVSACVDWLLTDNQPSK